MFCDLICTSTLFCVLAKQQKVQLSSCNLVKFNQVINKTWSRFDINNILNINIIRYFFSRTLRGGALPAAIVFQGSYDFAGVVKVQSLKIVNKSQKMFDINNKFNIKITSYFFQGSVAFAGAVRIQEWCRFLPCDTSLMAISIKIPDSVRSNNCKLQT